MNETADRFAAENEPSTGWRGDEPEAAEYARLAASTEEIVRVGERRIAERRAELRARIEEAERKLALHEELVAALRATLHVVDEPGYYGCEGEPCTCDNCVRSRAALAKAEGR